ncbi:MAG: phosphoenolpyruvate synthase, partial [Candidatus Roizmanbacteria bacterium]|nr:phosphoenolpyruvate synthase [Candidatus Roizmanbacteria bacterium]
MTKKQIVWFEEVSKEDVGLVGGKGANLGEMTNADFPIPYGFIVTSHAYFQFIKESNLLDRLKQTLSIINYDNPTEIEQASEHIQDIIIKAPMPKKLAHEIVEYYEELNTKENEYIEKRFSIFHHTFNKLKNLYDAPTVAVRSSATAEDLPDASFAGQQETYLNVKGDTYLLKKVKECWASLFTARAIYYRQNKGFDHFKVGLAAVVQRMVQSDKSGIAFSIDPVTNDKKKIVIEAVYGLGEYIVQGKVTPDHYEVDKSSIVIVKKQTAYQDVKFVRSGLGNKEVKLNKKEGSVQKLTENQIREVALLVKDIENHYYFPQDIEWAIEKGRLFVVQSRPITTVDTVINQDDRMAGKGHDVIVTGAPASPGIGVGHATIITSPKEISKIKHGDVLIAPQTNPDYVPAMKKASAIVTEKGGRTSHAAIVSRELGIPAVVGAEDATKKIKEDMVVSVNGTTGDVFQGSIISKSQISDIKSEKAKEDKQKISTITKIYANLAEPEIADQTAKLDVDGIGLLRAEFMIAEIGTHPREFIKQKQEKLFVNKLTRDIEKFVKSFSPRPVVYRATDFKTNEYRNLKGGKLYEPEEENPMIGFRGASRYIADPQVFSMELDAIQNIWDKGYTNLHLMIPFVRVPWEMVRIRDIVRDHGLLNNKGFKLWMMVEVPAAAIMLEEFIDLGIDGVSIGTNDLTMMLLGVDRDNSEVANIYDERHPAVISVLEHIVDTCTRRGITCSICGQAASDYPEIIEALVRKGITSVSVNPDAVHRTRVLIHDIEK